MSAAAICWAWERRGLQPLQKLVLIALADSTDSKCDVTIPIRKLTQMISEIIDTPALEISRIFCELEAHGLIEPRPEELGYSLLADPFRLSYQRATTHQIVACGEDYER